MSSVREKKPSRTCSKTYASYTSFKSYLRDDFNKRCGYCDDLDIYHGGVRGYQIDHFKPHSIEAFKHLKEDYSNLVYSCPFCNRAKSNKWQDEDGFIDPCEDEYDEHLARDSRGQIVAKTSRGQYIHKNLNLHLKRHELLWMIDKLEEQSKEIDKYLNILGEGHELELKILREFRKIQIKIKEYTNLFHGEI
jgi:hypothetical protein